MAAQLNYDYGTAKGVPGGKFDIAYDEVVTRKNEEENGVLKYGMAAMAGTSAGVTVKVPATGATLAQFEGVVLAAANTEQDMDGVVLVKKGTSVGVMKKGKVWGRTAEGCEATYGASALVVVDGDEAGSFTNKTAAYAYYMESEESADNALEVVEDSTSSPTSTQIKLSAVTPVADGYEPAVGDYVVNHQVHGTPLEVGATFGTESDEGIEVIVINK